MPRLHEIIVDVDVLLRLEPEELAGPLLQAIPAMTGQQGMFHPQSFSREGFAPNGPYPLERQADVLRAISEALAWLESQVLIVPSEGTNGQHGWRILSRRGARVAAEGSWESYLAASTLPQRLVHPAILEKTLFEFARGSYDAAIFQAFKAVEIAVRDAAPSVGNNLGVALMRAAFHPDTGPLADQSIPYAEREALMHLFGGAMGVYRNAAGHRSFDIAASQAAESIILASQLFKIVEARAVSLQPAAD